ncbi:hypothetical protein [Actinoplanes sp. HUAS TT8]|uniref:hypothetical protein n=1 Tax=Actinoplanes sp. HUAS TT8 TaxID=3447453 RepID=UPI003F528167
MRLRAFLRRLVLPPLAAGLAVTGLALPARADSLPEFPLLVVNITDSVTVIDGQSKTIGFDVQNIGGGAAVNTVITFNAAIGLGFTPPAGCTPTACKIDKLAGGERRHYSLTVKPDTTAANLTSSFTIGASADDVEFGNTTVQVVRTTKAGVDLEIGDLKDLKLGRGKSADMPVTVKNTGNTKSATLGLVMVTLDGVEPDMSRYRNCEKDVEVGGVVCVTDQTLAPGQTVTTAADTPVTVKLRDDAPGPARYFAGVVAVGLTDKYVAGFTKRNAGRAGATLKMTSTVSAANLTDGDIDGDLNEDDNAALFWVTAPTAPADSSAVGAVISGNVGDEVTVKVGTQNLGPFATVPLSLSSIGYVHVRIPSGFKLTSVDDFCLPGASLTDTDSVTGTDADLASRDWVCLVFDQIPKGGKSLFAFTGKIQDADHDTGFVQTEGNVQDTVSSDDKAMLTVEAGDSLPLTGPSAGLLAGGGVALLLVGLFLFRTARRRRIITVVE